jgi:hypothetical protein
MANWVTEGNNINNPNNEWLGTTNNQPLIIRTNNTERVRLTPGGDLMASRNATIGAGGDAVLRTRHIFGKGSGNDNDDALHLNWATGKPVVIGRPGGPASLSVNGDVEVTGDIRLLGADCAENFDVSEVEAAAPGTVMVIDQEGTLKLSEQAYDKRVAGVVSGAEGYKTGIVLDQQESEADRMPVALMGKVACKVDARHSPIEVGDLLTTSSTPGHAMKADDPLRAFGAVIGKALHSLKGGQGIIPVLIALQ